MDPQINCGMKFWFIDWIDVWMALMTIAVVVLTYLVIELMQLASKPPRVTATRYTQTEKEC